ncbi:MAG: diacylglycerol kinase family protein, partial [Bacteroidales bacterium]|nr:diacylglycerol kinase family protein [Bacteroidales bacterium]
MAITFPIFLYCPKNANLTNYSYFCGMSETKTAWYFIVNPRAGSGKAMSEWVPAEQMLVQEGIPFVTATTDHKNHAVALAHDAAAEGYRK